MGYHKKKIVKGTLGEFSKITEEYNELLDANEQGVKILELVELSDLIGAIEGYINNKYQLELKDLIEMKDLTKQAFKDGSRN